MEQELIFPAPLKPGDKIAVVSPAGIVKPSNVYNAIPILKDRGWNVEVYPHAFDRFGTFAGRPEARLADLKAALTDPSVRAIMCSRGGYGVVHLLEDLSELDLRADPKWVIGFSDISALHALMASQRVASIHSHMTSHLASYGEDDPDTQALFNILEGRGNRYVVASNPHNRQETARGPLLGGNLSVISDLMGTPFDMFAAGSILFIEDVSEPAYKIERMLYQLRLSGVMESLAGLIVGKFSKCALDVDFRSMETTIAHVVEPFDFPVCFDVPIGHVSHNLPLIEGAETTLTVGPDEVVIDQTLA